MQRAETAHSPAKQASVLTRAVLRAAELLGVPRKSLARVLGVSAASLSRLSATRTISPDSKEGELALLFVRVFRSLDSLMGGDEVAAREWLHARNDHLGGVPAELIQNVAGLVHVAQYLDAMRGRV